MRKVLFVLPVLPAVIAIGMALRQNGGSVMEWTIDGEKREASIIQPAKPVDQPAPVILVFHGHGGTMRGVLRWGFQDHWREAIIVCPQGLPTVTPRDPEGRRAGWQHKPGDSKDRDLKFVDAILKTLREKYKIDNNRIYATGHSNGGVFTYLLWAERGREFAAIAPSATTGAVLHSTKNLQPLPVLHVAGERDQLVPFTAQKYTMETVRRLLGCEPEGKEWAKTGSLTGTLYSSKSGIPFVSLIHPGTHQYPGEAPQLIVKFLKEQVKR